MSKYGGNNRIDFGVHFNTDKSSLAEVKKSLEQIAKMPLVNFKGSSTELLKLKETVKDVSSMLDSAFNAKLNTINVDKFKTSLDNSKHSLQSIYNEFSKAGAAGQRAFSQMASSVLTTNLQLKETHSLVNSMGRTMMNTVKWGIASSVMNNFTQSVSQAFQYVKSLDSALTDIRIVTGDSTEQMAKFADQANRAAQQLGRSTMDYSKAALTFYQQGLSDEDVAARTEATLKAQNITGAGEQMANYLTAVWNGYKVANEEAELYVDKLAAVADSSASNMSQLATAMSKVASTANLLGVPVDSLNAQIATIEATTRQAPETVGNALKTIYARINDIKTGSDDAEVSLGNYTEQMAKVGISVLDANGQLRDTGDVIEQIGGKWEGLSREQQIYLARTMAGQRQYNNLLALFENWGKYTDLLNVSMNAQGTTMQKNSRYMDSLAAHMEQLGAAGERVKSAMIDSDSFKGLIDIGTGLTNLFANLIESIGGGGNALLALGSVATQVFSGVITREISRVIENTQAVKNNLNQLKADIAITQQYGKIQGLSDNAIKQTVKMKQGIQQYYSIMNTQEINAYNNLVKKAAQQKTIEDNLRKQYELTQKVDKVQNAGKIFKVDGEIASFKEYQKELEQIQERINDIRTTRVNSSGAFQELVNEAKQFKKQIGPSLWEELDLSKLDELISKEEGTSEQAKILKNSLMEAMGQLRNVNTDQVQQLRQNLALAGAESEKAAKQVELYQQQMAQMAKVKAFVGIVSGLGQIASGLNSVINLTKIWKNQNLTGREKVFQTFTSLSMGIGLVIAGFKALTPAINLFGAAIIKNMTSGAVSVELADFSVMKLIASLRAGTTSLKGFLGSMIGLIGPVLAIGAAIGVMVGALVLLDKHYNKDANAAKQAAEQMNKAKQAYQQTKQSVDQLKTSIETISNAQNQLDSLTVGTEQWNSALQECNSTVLELIRNYPNLAQYVQNVNGQLRLSEEGQQQALKAAEERLSAANRAYQVTAQNYRDANITSLATDLGRNKLQRQGTHSSDRHQDISSENTLKVVNALIEVEKGFSDFDASTESLSHFISKQTQISEKTVSAILDSETQLQNLKNAVIENTNALKIENQSRAAQLMADQDYYKSASEEDQAVLNTLGAGVIKEAQDDWLEILRDPGRASEGWNLERSDEILAELSKVLGQNVKWASNNSIQGGKDNRQFAFQVEGSDQVVKYSDEYIASIMAAKDALEELEVSANDANNILQRIGNSGLGEGAQAGIKGFITGSGLGDLTQEEVQQLQGQQLSDIFKEGELQTIADAMGVEVDQLQDKFDNMVNHTDEAFTKVFYGLPRKAQSSFKKIQPSLEGLSLSAQQNIASALGKGFEKGGSTGLKQVEDILKTVDSEDLDAFGKILGNLNWDDEGSISQLNKAIEEQGLNIDTTSAEWIQFTNYLHDVIGAAHDAAGAFDKIRSSLSALNSLKDMKAGQVIDDQQYQKIIEKNKELEKFFKVTTDGYMFIGAQQQVEEILKSQANTAIEDFHNMKDAAKEIADSEIESDRVNKIASLELDDGEKIASTSQLSILNDLDNNTKMKNAMSALGVDQQALNSAIDWVKKHQGQAIEDLTEKEKAAYDENAAIIQDATSKLAQLQSDYQNGQFDDQALSSLYGGMAIESDNALQSLRNYYYEGKVLSQDYEDFREAAVQKEVERLGVTRDIYDETSETVRDQLGKVSDSFEELDDIAKDVQVDQLTSAVIQAGQALDEIGAISKDTLDQLQGLGELELGSNDQFIKLKENLQTIFDTDIDTSFIQQHFDLIRRLAEGDITALNDLQLALGQQFIADIQPRVNETGAQEELTAFSNYLNSFNFDDLQIGVSLEDSGFYKALSDFAIAAGLSATQINELLGNIGFEPQVTEQTIPMRDVQYSEQDGTYTYNYEDPVTGEITPIDVTTYMKTAQDGATSITVPIINGKKIKYKGGSGIGNFARPNYSRTAAPKSSGSGKGKSGSSSKPKVMKREKANQKTQRKQADPDPYYKINTAIAKQNKLLDILDKKESNLSGKERLQNLKKQNDELDKQIDNYEKYLSKSKQEETNTTAGLRKALQQKFNISFDKEGNIVDLNSINQQAINAYNNAVAKADQDLQTARKVYNEYADKYTKKSAAWQDKHDLEKQKVENTYKNAQEAQKKAVQAAKKEYDEKMEYLKKYQDALKNDEEIHEKLLDSLSKKIQHTFEASKIKVDLSLDSGEFLREWLDFENKVIKKISEDDTFGNALAKFQKLNTYFDNQQLQNTNAELKQLTKDLATMEAGGWAEGYKPSVDQLANLSAEEIEALRLQTLQEMRERLKDIQKEQQDALVEMQQLTQQIRKDYVDAINKAIDKWDEHIDQHERINDLVEHNIKLTEVLYGEKGYTTLDKYYQLQKKNNYEVLNQLQTEKNILENELSRIDYSVNPEAWETVKKQLDNVVDSINSKLQDMLDNLVKQFENKMNAAVDNINYKLTNGLGADYLDQQWDYLNNYDDYFLDTYNATTGVEDVTHAYQQAIDDAAANPKQQQKLNKLMNDQLKILKEKDKLTEYDLERAKSMLEVEKARMALEDARNNKTKMRLRRDSQGNYTYQYVADEEKLSDLQDALSKAQNDLYNMDKEHYKETLNTYYDTYKEFQTKMLQLYAEQAKAEKEALDTGDDTRLKSINEQIELMYNYYLPMLDSIMEDNRFNQMYITQSYSNGLGLDWTGLTDKESWQIITENVPWAASKIQPLIDNVNELGGALAALKPFIQSCVEATMTLNEEQEKVLNAGGVSGSIIGQVTDKQGQVLDKTIQNAQKMTQHTKDLVTATQQAVENMEKLLEVVDDYWGKHDKQLQSFINTLQSGFNTVMKFDTLTEDENGKATGARVLKAEDYNNGNYKTADISSANFTGDIAKDTNLLTALLNQAVAEYGEFLQAMINSSSSYSTGGYTGEWGTEGKLATLHQKELVLNEHDTENILAAVTAIRDATSNMNIQSQLNNLGNSTSNLLRNLIENGTLLDQNVHIDANFPNVTQHTQIEEAFNNLVNMAAMRASNYKD